ncbi:response regulator [Leptothrix sp. BB-4]
MRLIRRVEEVLDSLDAGLLLRLGQAMSGSDRLIDALGIVVPRLARALGAQGIGVLQVLQWQPASIVVQPWATPDLRDDVIDLDQLSVVAGDGGPLGRALRGGTVEQGSAEPVAMTRDWGWRADGVRQVIVLPVPGWAAGAAEQTWPSGAANPAQAGDAPVPTVAAIEFHDAPTLDQNGRDLLALVALQLSAVATRERERTLARQRDAQFAQVATLAVRAGRATVITDVLGVVEWVHPGFSEVTGLGADTVLGQPLWAVLTRDLAPGDEAAQLRERFASKGSFRHELSARLGPLSATPGQAYWLEVDVVQVLDETSGRLQLVCQCSDISARKARESDVDEQRELLGALTENLPISLLVVDVATMELLSFNRHAQLEFGISPASGRPTLGEAMGRGLSTLMLPQLREVMKRPSAVEHEFVWETADGQRLIRARHVAVRGRHGPRRLVISQLRDVTRQRRDEQRLRESETRYRELVETIDEGVFISNPTRDAWYYIGPRVYEMLGLNPADRRDHPDILRALVLPEDAALLDQQREHEEALEATDVTLRIQHPTRGLRWLRQRTRTRALPAGEARVYGLLDDVTDERERALQLQSARDVAEAASQAKSQFMASMSHEIRTPMNGILGMTELLLGTPLDDRQRRFAQSVYRSGENLLEIINDVLDFSKIEAGRLELAPSDFHLRTLIEDTLDLLAPRAHEKGLELSLRETGPTPTSVVADALRLRQVLTNLVANAIKFTEHGEVTVDVKARPGSPGEAPLMLEFRVRDTGIGIEPEMQPRLFQAFSQAHGGMGRRYGGTGLGLAISRQLVELMGGRIDVGSQPGIGSEFRFTLAVEPGSASEHQAGELAALPQLRVLVVDDSSTNRTVLDHLLSAWGMSVALSPDGHDALSLLRGQPADAPPFDVALVDWRMPGLDGIGFARAVREQGLAPRMKLIMLSSASAPDDVKVAQQVGFDRFVHKPVRKAELRQALLGVSQLGVGEVSAAPLGAQVLVIEDNPVNQEVMAQMLTRLGCGVRVAANALDGLRSLCDQSVDIVLMDIQMPGMDGIEALSWIRRGRTSRFALLTPADVPVVAVTANALDGDDERFLGLGFDAYLPKPYRQAQLLSTMQRLLPALVAHTTDVDTSLDPVGFEALLPAAVAGRMGTWVTEPRYVSTRPDGLGTVTVPMASGPSRGSVAGDMAVADAAGPAPTLDPQALMRLRELDPGGQNRLVERVLKAFDQSIGRMLTQLAEGQAARDIVQVRQVLHTLKSSSHSVGALTLAQMCVDCELQLRQGADIGQLGNRLNQLQLEMLRVQQGLIPYLEPSPA